MAETDLPWDARERGRRARIAVLATLIGGTVAIRAAVYLAELLAEANQDYATEQRARRDLDRKHSCGNCGAPQAR